MYVGVQTHILILGQKYKVNIRDKEFAMKMNLPKPFLLIIIILNCECGHDIDYLLELNSCTKI